MSPKKSFLIALCLSLTALPLFANTNVEELDLTGFPPSPRIPNLILGYPIGQHWQHCSQLRFRVNDTLDPIPNPLGQPFLHVADVIPVLQQAAELWNAVPTSFLKVKVNGTYSNTGRTKFDLVNEISFRTGPFGTLGFPNVAFRGVFERTQGPIAALRRTILLADFNFKDGLDLNGDGVPDVSNKITDCTQVNGQTVYPEGLYKAGAPLDMDIMFSVGANIGGVTDPGFRLTIDPAQIDDNPQSVDLFAVAAQAFGLAQSVGHSMNSQQSNVDGTDSVMYPYLDAGDPQSELDRRKLDIDSALTLSRIYPRGSAEDPKPLAPGEAPFLSTVGTITGNIIHGETGDNLLGSQVFAIDHATGRVVSSTVGGHSVWDTQKDGFNSVLTSVAANVLDGKYTLVVPPGTYDIRVAPADDQPAGHQHINLETLAAWLLGVEVGPHSYNETYYNGGKEGALKRLPGDSTPVTVSAGETVSGVDIVTSKSIDIANFGSLDSLGSTAAQPGSYYAVRIPVDQYMAAYAATNNNAVLQGASFMTGVNDGSVVPVFAEAQFTTGRVNADGTANLDLFSPIERVENFVGRDFDFAPFWFPDSGRVAVKVANGIAKGKVTDLFLVLRVPKSSTFPGASNTPPLIGRDGSNIVHDRPIYGLSYVSNDGRTFTPVNHFNFMFKLMMSEKPAPTTAAEVADDVADR